MKDILKLGDKEFSSRLFLGTGKFSSNDVLKKAITESETEIVTVALRRVDTNDLNSGITSVIDRTKVLLLPNTSGARDANEAVRLSKLARLSGCGDFVKLELTPDPKHLLPDPIETLKAAKILVKEGFKVMPYINADPVLAKRLEEVGCVCVMPLGAPIGTNRGLKTIDSVKIIIENSFVPVVVDAGLGAPSDASLAMEIGADAVLINTAIATANDPINMAKAFKDGVNAGRLAYLAGLAGKSEKPSASTSQINIPL
jgi:thiazole synthase